MGRLTHENVQSEVNDWQRSKNRHQVGIDAGLTGGVSASDGSSAHAITEWRSLCRGCDTHNHPPPPMPKFSARVRVTNPVTYRVCSSGLAPALHRPFEHYYTNDLSFYFLMPDYENVITD